MTFQVGDKVIYPNHGLGVVQGIETKTILGTTCGFYHLRMVANETTVLVPVDNVDGVGSPPRDRRPGNRAAVLAPRRRQDRQPSELERTLQGQFGSDAHGSIYDVVEVLKSLTFLARSKNLSFREKRMLDRAKFLVVSEISEVSREVTIMVEEKVDRALERCFTMKNRSIARAKAAKATHHDAHPRAPDCQSVLTSRRNTVVFSGRKRPKRFRPFFCPASGRPSQRSSFLALSPWSD